MRIPAQKPINRTRETITHFGGLNCTKSVGKNEFSDMLNLTSDNFPLLSVRNKRAILTAYNQEYGTFVQGSKIYINNDITAVANVNGSICYCTRTDVYVAGEQINGVKLNSYEPKRSIVPFGNGFFVVPDGIYAVINDSGVSVKRANFSNIIESNAQISVCRADGTVVSCTYIGESTPQSPASGCVWADTSSNAVERVYTNGEWQQNGRLYIKISGTGIEQNAYEGLLVELTGVYSQNTSALYPVVGTLTGGVIIDAPLTEPKSVLGECGIKKTMPLLDFAAEHNNRIWGCRFGKNKNGETVNEIYASKLGNPVEWEVFSGISTDSYITALGCSGIFTGVCALSSELLFFKENYIIKVSGFSPSDFYVSSYSARGVEPGAHLSVINFNEKVFYKNAAGIMVYDGALPYCISSSLGSKTFTAIAAGAVGSKYYVAARDEDGTECIYVYDTRLDLWHREDNSFHVNFFVYKNNCLYMLCRVFHSVVTQIEYNSWLYMLCDKRLADEADKCFDVTPSEGTEYNYVEQDNFSWYAESGRLGSDSGTNVLRMLVFRLSLEKGAEFNAQIMTYPGGEWKDLHVNCLTSGEAFSVPVNTPRCSFFRLRLSGKGGCTVYSIGTVTEKMSEVNALGR